MTDRLPMPTANTWVGVDRDVLVRMLGRLAGYADELGEESSQRYYQMASDVEQGRIDVLSRQVWEGGDSCLTS